MQRIRKGDEVIVIAGRSKGQRGHVLKVLANERLLVENVNMVKRHTSKCNHRRFNWYCNRCCKWNIFNNLYCFRL